MAFFVPSLSLFFCTQNFNCKNSYIILVVIMLNREQRGKNNQISLIPIPNRHITTDVTVTLTKLDDNKNNNKSRLFSTTCSRRAQEEKNYNKRAIINNKNLSSFYLPKQKMNIKTVPAKNNNNNITLRKSPLTQLKQDLERLRQQVFFFSRPQTLFFLASSS